MSQPERAIEYRQAVWPGGPWLAGILLVVILFGITFTLGMLLA